MLSCEEASEMIVDYIDGRVSFSMRMELIMHVMVCRHCRRYLKQFKHVISLVEQTPADDATPPNEDVEQDLLSAYRAKHGK